MKNYFNKYHESYKRYGLISFVNQILSKIKLNIKFKDPIQKKRIYLSKKLNELTNGKIIDGIYKGSKFIYSSDFFLAKSAQLLGCYEKEVQEKIFELSKKYNLNYFMSIGAGEGYHAIGSRVANLFEHSLCFELEKKNREIIKKNFNLNSINENFDIFGKADLDFFEVIKNKVELNKSLFLLYILPFSGLVSSAIDMAFSAYFKKSYIRNYVCVLMQVIAAVRTRRREQGLHGGNIRRALRVGLSRTGPGPNTGPGSNKWP